MRWAVILVAALLVGVLTYGVIGNGDDSTIDTQLAKGNHPAAPNATLPTLGTNQPASLKSFRGKYVLVNFWASWCGPCKAEVPDLQKVQKDLGDKGMILGINSRDNSEDGDRFVADHDITYPSLHDGSGDYATKWNVHQYPESFLLDPSGRILAAIHGELTDKWIADNIAPLAAKS